MHENYYQPGYKSWLNEYPSVKTSKTNYKQIFSHLTNHMDINDFFTNYWEKQPVLFRRHSESEYKAIQSSGKQWKALEVDLLSKSSLLSIISTNTLSYDKNFKIVKYSNHKQRVEYDVTRFKNGIVSGKNIEKGFSEGYTAQFFQPQRFSIELQSINAGFEYILGTLAGSSAYLTPPNAQGLAPHHDDIEAFILQTEGTKLWRLWKPTFELPDTHSNDIPRENLSKDYIEFTLYPGDMLYFPRGTIHEAISQDSFSTHVTISTYQRHHNASLISHLIPKLVETSFQSNIELRRGLPIRLSDTFGSFINRCQSKPTNQRAEVLSIMKQRIHDLADSLTIDVLDECVDEISEDFAMNRLPPPSLQPDEDFKSILEQHNKKNKSKATYNQVTKVCVCDPSSFHRFVNDVDGIMTLCLSNSRNRNPMTHMGHPVEDSNVDIEDVDEDQSYESDDDGRNALSQFECDTYLPVVLLPIIEALVESYPKGIPVDELFFRAKDKNIPKDEVTSVIEILDRGGYLEGLEFENLTVLSEKKRKRA